MADNTDDLIISISTDQATLRRSIKRIEQDLSGLAGSVQKQFAVAGKSIDNSVTSSLQNRINGMIGIGKSAAKEWTGALADQGKELERLRAKYSPLFNTINNYKTAVSDIKRAHAIGAISANEMAAAISKERQAALASTAAIKGRNAALADTPVMRGGRGQSGGNFQTGNIAAQFQDIGVTAFGGMSPMTIALQQGTQLSAVLSQMKGEGQSTGKALLGAFTSIVSPISLVTIGLVAGTAALIQYFTSADSGNEKLKAQLEAQVNLIETVAQKWGDAYPALKAYSDELVRARDATQLQEAQTAATERTFKDLAGTLDTMVKISPLVSKALRDATSPEVTTSAIAYEQAVADMRAALESGKDPAEAFGRAAAALSAIIAGTGSEALKKYGDQFDVLAGKIDGAMNKADQFRARTPVQDIVAGSTFTDGGRTYRPTDFTPVNPGVPTRRPLVELEGMPGSEKVTQKAETAAQRAANAYRDLLKSADDRIGQLRQEIDLTGKFGAEAEAARFKLDLLQASEDKGRSLSEEQRSALEKKVALYKQYSDMLARTKLAQDLLEERRFNTLSAQDQKITTTLKQYGRPTDLNSQEAKDIRNSLNANDLADGIKSFGMEFSGGLITQGKDLGEAFGDAVKNAAQDQMQKSLDSLFGQIGNAIAQSIFGGPAAVPGVASATAPIASVAGSVFGKAPVGAVTRAALPDVGATTDIASYIAKGAAARGMDPAIALRVAKSEGGLDSWNLQSNFVKNGVREQSFGPFQLYKGGGLGNRFMKQTGLDPALAQNGPAATDFALDTAKKEGWGAWYGAKKAGVGNWDGIGVGSGSKSAVDAVNNLADASKDATVNLGGFGSGLGKLGQSLSTSAFPAAPSAPGGGGLSWLQKLFTPDFASMGGQAGLAASGKFIGMYANGGTIRGPGSGTSDSIPIMASNEEFMVNARQSKKHRALLHAINNGTLGQMAVGGVVGGRSVPVPVAPALATRRAGANDNGQPGILQVQIMGANGDEHVKALVRQGVSDGLGKYNKDQERGGIGTVQGQHSKRKG